MTILFFIKGKRFYFFRSFMTQNIRACLSDLSFIPKAHMNELLLPIIENSSISILGLTSSAGSNAKEYCF